MLVLVLVLVLMLDEAAEMQARQEDGSPAEEGHTFLPIGHAMTGPCGWGAGRCGQCCL